MRIFFLMFLVSIPLPALAQEAWDTDFAADLTVVTGIFNDDQATEPKNGMGEVSLTASTSRVLENGVKLTGSLTFRAQNDHPVRPGFAGAPVLCPPADPACASLNGQGLRGGFSRLSTVGFSDDAGARGSLERAYLEVDGGWGALSVGRDSGIAARFFEGEPTVFSLARTRDPILDPTGINAVRTRNDISSSAAKVSYVSPRILGVRAGLSYTPDASVRSLDLETSRNAPGVIEPELEDAIEVGLQASRLVRSMDLRFRGSLTWSDAGVETPIYDDIETVSFGLDVERSDAFRLGFSVLESTNGGLGDYSSLGIGAEYNIADWVIGINGAQADDGTIGLETRSATVGLSRELNDVVGLSVGYRTTHTELDAAPIGWTDNIDQQGVLLELRIRK